MITYTTISTDEDNYRLSALMTDKGYEMASLEILLDGEEIAFWDNDIYLYDTVYPILKKKEHSDEIADDIPEEDYDELLELFEKGEQLGFFNNMQRNNSYLDENAGEDIPYNS